MTLEILRRADLLNACLRGDSSSGQVLETPNEIELELPRRVGVFACKELVKERACLVQVGSIELMVPCAGRVANADEPRIRLPDRFSGHEGHPKTTATWMSDPTSAWMHDRAFSAVLNKALERATSAEYIAEFLFQVISDRAEQAAVY